MRVVSMTTIPDGTLSVGFLLSVHRFYAFNILMQFHQVLDPNYLITLTWSVSTPPLNALVALVPAYAKAYLTVIRALRDRQTQYLQKNDSL